MLTLSNLSTDSTVVASTDQVSSDLADEVVVLDLKTGTYHGLDAVGARIWSLIQHPTLVTSVRDAIVDEFDVTPDRCEKDLLALLRQLEQMGLIETVESL